MSQLFISIVIGGVAIVAFSLRISWEKKLEAEGIKRGRKTALIEPMMLPLMFVVVFLMLLIMDGGNLLIRTMLVDWALLFVYISVYYAVLLLLLPLLRRVLSAWACASLWLVPTLLYFTVYFWGYMSPPRFIITVSPQWLPTLLLAWLIGFVAVVIWQLVSHLFYRRSLLSGAEELTDKQQLFTWGNQARRHGIKARIPVLVSDAVSTPVTIGCFERTMRLVLPRQGYNEQELQLIFSHELRHILRADSRTKVFIGLCAAICWFNPLSWIARSKVAEDLELSCDEAVLAEADDATRRQYAELLLKNAGNSRGYTTCLSASANSLRYRLRHVVKPSRRLSGSIAVGLAIFALLMSVGTVAVAGSPVTVQAAIFEQAPQDISIAGVYANRWNGEMNGTQRIYKWNEQLLSEYLASLRVQQIYSHNYSYSYSYSYEDVRYLEINYRETVDGELGSLTRFIITDEILLASIPYDDYGYIAYSLEDDVDWGYLGSLLDFAAKNTDPAPQPPEMLMYFAEGLAMDNEPMYAMRTVDAIIKQGERNERNEDVDNLGVGGMAGAPVTRVRLEFTYPPFDGEFTVQVEDWERSTSYTVSSSELVDGVLPLAAYSAHYTVSGTFASTRGTVYEMRFFFDVQMPE